MFVTRLRRFLGIHSTTLLCWSFALVCMAAATPAAEAQESLAQAKVLYAAASYEEALAMLDKLSASSDQDATAIAEHRVFCLLALGRSEDANRAIETVLRLNPFYKPSEAQVPPRIQTVIKAARRQLLPSIVLASYADAKDAFERKDPTAYAQFDRLLMLLDDPDAKNVAALADLHTVAIGFRDLAKAAAMPPPAPVITAPPPPAASLAAAPPPSPAASSGESSLPPGAKPTGNPAPGSNTKPPSPAAAPNRAGSTPKVIYDITDQEVVGPVAVNQRLPMWRPTGADMKATFKGVLHLIIDDRGYVTTADMKVAAHPVYDEELIRSARSWRFKPAMRGGVSVPYMKLVEITLSPLK